MSIDDNPNTPGAERTCSGLRLLLAVAMCATGLSADAGNGAELRALLQSYDSCRTFAQLAPKLQDQTIVLDGIKSNRLTTFELAVPDTVWLKERPKKNPKEGKHYRLRRLYGGVYDASAKSESTPADVIAGRPFTVTAAEGGPWGSRLTLLDPETGSEVVWTYT